MWKIVDTNTKLFNNFYNYVKTDNIVLLKTNNYKYKKYKENDCHNNVNTFLKNNKNNYAKILGYYVLSSKNDDEILAIQHSVIINLLNNKLIDITPCSIYNNKLFIYGYKMKEYASIQYTDKKIKVVKTNVNNIDGYFL